MTDESAWTPIPDYERYWKPFDSAFSFAPTYADSRTGVTHPGITEPPGSVTFSLAPITDSKSPATFWAGVHALNGEVLRGFVTAFAEGERLVVLDWQHQGYWLRPDLLAADVTPDGVGLGNWPVSPFPDGDYHVFLSEDHSSGTFGHPWEQSLCVFGPTLVDALVPTLSSWLPILRRSATT